MNSKKNLIIGAIVVVVLIAGGFLLKGGSLGGGAGTGQPGIGIFSNKMTDEVYIKIMTDAAKITAQSYTAGNSGQTPETTENEMENLLRKYGISEEEFGRYMQALQADKVRSAAMQEKLVKIMTEWLKTGGK